MPRHKKTESIPIQIIQHQSADVAKTDQSPATKITTQSQIGIVYVYGFLGIIAFVLLFTLWNCYKVVDIKDLLLAISGVLSGPLGFIIGYYFKEDTQNKSNI